MLADEIRALAELLGIYPEHLAILLLSLLVIRCFDPRINISLRK